MVQLPDEIETVRVAVPDEPTGEALTRNTRQGAL
jgi:hypothetical protein